MGLFTVDITASAFVFAWVRLRSGSVWPAVLLHASWNAVIQGVFDRSTVPGSVWVGESGVITGAVEVAVACVLVFFAWPKAASRS